MKTPKTIKAYALIEGNNPKIDIFDIFKDQDVVLKKGEKKCLVEIKFVKYIE